MHYRNDTDKANGTIFGPHGRAIIFLPVEPLGKQGDTLSIHFIVDTSAPTTYLFEAAMKALFAVENLKSIISSNVNIWGIKLARSRPLAHL